MKHLMIRLGTIISLSSILLSVALISLMRVSGLTNALAQEGNLLGESATARVWVAHLAPFSNTITGTAVNVLVNGGQVLTDFKFGETSETYLELPAGISLTIEVSPTLLTTPGISLPVVLTQTEYTISAIGNGASEAQKLDFLLLEDDNSAPIVGYGRLRVIHAAPFNSIPALTSVDILIDGMKVLASFGYKDTSPYLEFPAGVHEVEVQAFGGLVTITDTLTLTDGVVLTVFAIGDVTHQPVGVMPVTNREYPIVKVYLPLILKN